MKAVYISSLGVGVLSCILVLKHLLTFLLQLIVAVLLSICSSHQHLFAIRWIYLLLCKTLFLQYGIIILLC